MWTRANCGLYKHKGPRYPSDLRYEKWASIAPLILSAKRYGRRFEAVPRHRR